MHLDIWHRHGHCFLYLSVIIWLSGSVKAAVPALLTEKFNNIKAISSIVLDYATEDSHTHPIEFLTRAKTIPYEWGRVHDVIEDPATHHLKLLVTREWGHCTTLMSELCKVVPSLLITQCLRNAPLAMTAFAALTFLDVVRVHHKSDQPRYEVCIVDLNTQHVEHFGFLDEECAKLRWDLGMLFLDGTTKIGVYNPLNAKCFTRIKQYSRRLPFYYSVKDAECTDPLTHALLDNSAWQDTEYKHWNPDTSNYVAASSTDKEFWSRTARTMVFHREKGDTKLQTQQEALIRATGIADTVFLKRKCKPHTFHEDGREVYMPDGSCIMKLQRHIPSTHTHGAYSKLNVQIPSRLGHDSYVSRRTENYVLLSDSRTTQQFIIDLRPQESYAIHIGYELYEILNRQNMPLQERQMPYNLGQALQKLPKNHHADISRNLERLGYIEESKARGESLLSTFQIEVVASVALAIMRFQAAIEPLIL